MKPYYIYIIAFFLLGFANHLFSQTTEQDWCHTPVTEDHLARVNIDEISRSTSFYSVRIFVHIVNETNGTGGVSRQAVLDELKLVQEAYEPFICLYLVGIDEINNSYYTSNWSKSKGELLGTVNSHSTAIDAYILPSYTNAGGNAYAIPNLFFTMGGDRFGISTFSHELGHCLGLYHTHETAFGAERVNGSNCSSAGDKVCDTPADPRLGTSNVTFPGCVYTGIATDSRGDFYNPDPSIVMSYAVDVSNGISCRDRFTTGQFSRMMATLVVSLPQVLVSSENLLLHSQTISSGQSLKTARSSITTGALAPPIYGDYTVRNSAFVTHTAGDRIILVPGFEAQPNSSGYYEASVRKAICNSLNLDEWFLIASDEEQQPEIFLSNPNPSTADHNQQDEHSFSSSLHAKTYPNPFSDHLTLELELPDTKEVSVVMLNAMGQIINVVEKNQIRYAGNHRILVSASNLPSGIYYFRIQVGEEQLVEKVMKR